MRGVRLVRCASAALTGVLLISVVGCAGASAGRPRVALSTECSTAIIVAFIDDDAARLVQDIARAADVSLVVGQRLLPARYVLELRSAEQDSSCAAAVARLRADPRIQSVELDARRAPHDGD